VNLPKGIVPAQSPLRCKYVTDRAYLYELDIYDIEDAATRRPL
jgi:hypothetical protein